MYNTDKGSPKQNSINDELDELFSNSNNQVQVTMELATNTNEMINDVFNLAFCEYNNCKLITFGECKPNKTLRL